VRTTFIYGYGLRMSNNLVALGYNPELLWMSKRTL
jgi:hypothetical protein